MGRLRHCSRFVGSHSEGDLVRNPSRKGKRHSKHFIGDIMKPDESRHLGKWHQCQIGWIVRPKLYLFLLTSSLLLLLLLLVRMLIWMSLIDFSNQELLHVRTIALLYMQKHLPSEGTSLFLSLSNLDKKAGREQESKDKLISSRLKMFWQEDNLFLSVQCTYVNAFERRPGVFQTIGDQTSC